MENAKHFSFPSPSVLCDLCSSAVAHAVPSFDNAQWSCQFPSLLLSPFLFFMLFNFTLVPLEEVTPWENSDGGKCLSWFALTDGQYWIQAGDAALFEFRAPLHAQPDLPRYCDYQVARLHEDLLEILPAVFEPVPADLIPYLSVATDSPWETTFRTWCKNAETKMDAGHDDFDEDYYWDMQEAAGLDREILIPCISPVTR